MFARTEILVACAVKRNAPVGGRTAFVSSATATVSAYCACETHSDQCRTPPLVLVRHALERDDDDDGGDDDDNRKTRQVAHKERALYARPLCLFDSQVMTSLCVCVCVLST